MPEEDKLKEYLVDKLEKLVEYLENEMKTKIKWRNKYRSNRDRAMYWFYSGVITTLRQILTGVIINEFAYPPVTIKELLEKVKNDSSTV